MDSELLYLKQRAHFHRRMARQASCGEARCAHEAFVRAYLDRIERRMGPSQRDRANHEDASRASTAPAASAAPKPELVR